MTLGSSTRGKVIVGCTQCSAKGCWVWRCYGVWVDIHWLTEQTVKSSSINAITWLNVTSYCITSHSFNIRFDKAIVSLNQVEFQMTTMAGWERSAIPAQFLELNSQQMLYSTISISRRKVQKLRDQSQNISKNIRALQYWRWACGTCCKQYHMLFYIQMAVVSTAIFFLLSLLSHSFLK